MVIALKIIVSPDSFKGSLSAAEAAEYIEQGIKRADPTIEVKKIPVADGGEGFVKTLITATSGKIIFCRATGPNGIKIDSFWGVLGDGVTAIVEAAAAAGLLLLPDHAKNPLHTTTFGVGELILQALQEGYRKIIIGIGGSATNDGGMGMAQALGVSFYDKNDNECGLGGRYLEDIACIDLSGLSPLLKNTEIMAACDVTNPFYGPEGAAFVYAPQKGASFDDVIRLDQGLKNLSEIIKRDLCIDVQNIPGSGAAGGLGGGLAAFTKARLKPGVELVLDACRFTDELSETSLVITGEGQTDAQTIYGKVPSGIATQASLQDVPVVCLSGSLAPGHENIFNHGITAAFSICPGPIPLREAMSAAGLLLEQAAFNLVRLFIAARR